MIFNLKSTNEYFGGYVGFIQLPTLKVRKIVSLQVWQGSQYEELASHKPK